MSHFLLSCKNFTTIPTYPPTAGLLTAYYVRLSQASQPLHLDPCFFCFKMHRTYASIKKHRPLAGHVRRLWTTGVGHPRAPGTSEKRQGDKRPLRRTIPSPLVRRRAVSPQMQRNQTSETPTTQGHFLFSPSFSTPPPLQSPNCFDISTFQL